MDNDENTPASSDDRAGRDATHPDSAGADAPTERLDDATAPARADSSTPDTAPAAENHVGGRSRNRRILIGAGAAVALLAFGGGAFAIGTAVADDDDDDRPGIHAPGSRDGDARGGQPGHGPGGDREDDRDERPGDAGAASAPADAGALRAAAEAAIEHSSAEGITSIEIERGGYDIDARLSDGSEVDLFVTPEGSVRERGGDEANDDDDDPLIDLAQLGDILAAAQSAATDAGATETAFHALSTSSSGAVYEVELRGGDRSEVEVELDADLGVVQVDIDS
ncbi:hypothetical protein ACIPV2_12460 [Microbacterium sp. NPDC089987]|uniref:hypothetical protein n=1 Tax=Microbacterium sp. NPDC089987 TaxID=3364202 RepID=UPI003823FA43